MLLNCVIRCNRNLIFGIMSRKRGNFSGHTWKSRPLRVLVDMDGVLCDFEAHFCQKFQDEYPNLPFIPLKERRTFYLADQYCKLDPDHTERVRSIIDAAGFFRHIPPIPGALDAIKEISSLDNTEVFICTSPMVRSCYSASEKLEWIKEHLGSDWLKQVVIAHDKTMVQGDILIDDRPHIKGTFEKPSWEQVIYTAAHNGHLDVKDLKAVVRLDSWDNKQELMRILGEFRSRIA